MSLALVIVAQALPAPHHRPMFITVLVHFYILTSSILGLILELELSEWFVDKFIPILRYWLVRGLFYVFLALFAAEESIYAHSPDDHDEDTIEDDSKGFLFFHMLGSRLSSIILKVSAGGLFITGSLYVIMGGLFMQGLKKRSEEAYEIRLRESEDN